MPRRDLHRGLLSSSRISWASWAAISASSAPSSPCRSAAATSRSTCCSSIAGLNCLVAIELKVGRFEPEYLGKLGFYLEALDRDVRKPHEQPAIGVLLCASKDEEVVEYALSRTLSPALIAEYRTQLPDKKLLQAKLHEFYRQNVPDEDDA